MIRLSIAAGPSGWLAGDRPSLISLKVLCRRLGVQMERAHDGEGRAGWGCCSRETRSVEEGAAVGIPAAAGLQRLIRQPSPIAARA